jgi:tRNA modification GTPase
MQAALADEHRGEILRDGFLVVIAGPPNVGKSSLINAIARREAAIVSAEPGTTRDIVELQLNLGGLAVILADTAGVRDAEGNIEREGIRRGLERASSAGMVLWVMDATAPDPYLPPQLKGLEPVTLRVLNKSDLTSGPGAAVAGVKFGLAISTRTGEGLAALEREIGDAARRRTRDGEPSLITAARHRQHIQTARDAVEDFLSGPRDDLELRAEDLRRAAQAIGRLVGRVDAEEILGEIFGRFCIGK